MSRSVEVLLKPTLPTPGRRSLVAPRHHRSARGGKSRRPSSLRWIAFPLTHSLLAPRPHVTIRSLLNTRKNTSCKVRMLQNSQIAHLVYDLPGDRRPYERRNAGRRVPRFLGREPFRPAGSGALKNGAAGTASVSRISLARGPYGGLKSAKSGGGV
jgi:hypothetical protein